MAYRVSSHGKVIYHNDHVGKPGKGRKVKRVQTIILGGDPNNKCRPLITRTILHYQ